MSPRTNISSHSSSEQSQMTMSVVNSNNASPNSGGILVNSANNSNTSSSIMISSSTHSSPHQNGEDLVNRTIITNELLQNESTSSPSTNINSVASLDNGLSPNNNNNNNNINLSGKATSAVNSTSILTTTPSPPITTSTNLKDELCTTLKEFSNMNDQQQLGLCVNGKIQQINSYTEIYNQSNNQLNINSINKLNSNSNNLVKLDSTQNQLGLNTSPSNTLHMQWAGKQQNYLSDNFNRVNGNQSNNTNARYTSSCQTQQQTNQTTSPYLSNSHFSNATSNGPNQTQFNSNNLVNSSTSSFGSSPYLDYNNYGNSVLTQASTPPSTVPNMFTAAAVAATSAAMQHNTNINSTHSNSNSSTPKSSSVNSSDFSFNSNNSNSSTSSLNKKYLTTPPNSNGSNAGLDGQSITNEPLDALFYNSTNNINKTNLSTNQTTLTNNTSIQQPQYQQQQQLLEFSAPLANNYANFAPNSNPYWQSGSSPPGSISQQLNMSNGMYQQQSPSQQIVGMINHHTSPTAGHPQLDEASQASTPNSQLDDLRAETPKISGVLNQTNVGQASYLGNSSSMNASNNSSSNSSSSSSNTTVNSNGITNGKGMPVYSFPPTPNTIGSPGASVMSTGFYDEYEPAANTTWSKTNRMDGLMKLYEISNEPGRKIFLDKLIMFNEERGATVSSCPTINKNLIDLYRLYTCVKERGGFLQTTKSKLWKDCAINCQIKVANTTAYILRKQYVKHILPFECKYDLNGADPNCIVAQTENANRKKRKSKNSSTDVVASVQLMSNNSSNVLTNNTNINSTSGIQSIPTVNSNKELIGQCNLMQSMQNLRQQQHLQQVPTPQHCHHLQQQQQQIHLMQSPAPHLSMQNYSSGLMNDNSIVNINNSNSNSNNSTSNNPVNLMSNNNSMLTRPNFNNSSGYTGNYNNSMNNYGQQSLPPASNTYTNNIYSSNTTNLDFNSKMVSSNQQSTYFNNSSQNTNNGSLLPMQNQRKQQQSYYNNNTIINTNSIYNNTSANNNTTSNDFYASYPNDVHANNNTIMYSNTSNLHPQHTIYNEDMLKYGNSITTIRNNLHTENINSNLSSSNSNPNLVCQSNSSSIDNSQSNQQYTQYNGLDNNYNNYNRPAPTTISQINQSSNQCMSSTYSVNAYSNSDPFDKTNNSLIGFQSLKNSGSMTNSSIDSYSDTYSNYEPEQKRFHADFKLSNC